MNLERNTAAGAPSTAYPQNQRISPMSKFGFGRISGGNQSQSLVSKINQVHSGSRNTLVMKKSPNKSATYDTSTGELQNVLAKFNSLPKEKFGFQTFNHGGDEKVNASGGGQLPRQTSQTGSQIRQPTKFGPIHT